MADALTDSVESFSSWWRAAALVTMAGGFAVLILLTRATLNFLTGVMAVAISGCLGPPVLERRTIYTSFGPRIMPLPIQTGGLPVQDRPIRPVYHVINRQKAARSGAF